MNPSLLALLLIVNLLMCPVRCLAHEAKAAGSQESVESACACCSHSDEGTSSETPSPCSDSCDCENCICEGAVLESEIDLSDPLTHFGDAQDSLLTFVVIVTQPASVTPDQDLTSRQLLSGRDLRVSHQSWLL